MNKKHVETIFRSNLTNWDLGSASLPVGMTFSHFIPGWRGPFRELRYPQGHTPILMKFLSHAMWVIYLLLKC